MDDLILLGDVLREPRVLLGRGSELVRRSRGGLLLLHHDRGEITDECREAVELVAQLLHLVHFGLALRWCILRFGELHLGKSGVFFRDGLPQVSQLRGGVVAVVFLELVAGFLECLVIGRLVAVGHAAPISR